MCVGATVDVEETVGGVCREVWITSGGAACRRHGLKKIRNT